MPTTVQRKLTTVLAADAAGYSRRMEIDEVGTLAELRFSRDVFVKFIERHQGRVANTAGDGLIAEFPSVVEAVQCAIEVQRELATMPHEYEQLFFRIGIHLGDVVVDGQDLLGEGVNLAARLQTMAEPGGILISQQVFDQVRSKLTVGFDYLGEKRPKNYSEDVPVYRVSGGGKSRSFRLASKSVSPKPRTTVPPRMRSETSPDAAVQILRNAKVAGLILAGLLTIDVATGTPFWMHWPAVALCTVLALQATSVFFQPGITLLVARVAIVATSLLLINLFSWSGYFWALWPVGAIVFLGLIWKVARTRDNR